MAHLFKSKKQKIHSIFILDGEIEIENKNILKGTFINISQTDNFEIFCNKKSTILK